MNLTLHIVRNDLVRLRGWLACWVGVLLVPILIGLFCLTKNQLEREWTLPRTLAIVTGVEVLIAYLLTILLVQGDGIVGTRQFWLTRPISRGRLLRAKALGAFVVIGLIPIAISLPWWLWCGFGFGQIASAAAEMLMVLSLIMVAAAVIAVLTDSLARALLWTLVLVAGFFFAGFFFSIVNNLTARSNHDMALAISRCVVAVVATGTVLASTVIVQFLVRRRGWWLGAGAVSIVVVLFAAAQWPWPWVPAVPREVHPERAAGVTVRLGRATAGPAPVRTEQNRGRELVQEVDVRFVASGVPDKAFMGVVQALHHWSWPGGVTVNRLGGAYGSTDPFAALGLLRPDLNDPETRRWRQAGDERPREQPEGVTARTWTYHQPSMVARMRSQPPHYTARVWWGLARPEIRFEMPLESKAWQKRAGHSLRIDRLERSGDGVTALIVETHPALIRDMLREASGALTWIWRFTPNYGRFALLAINRERGEVIFWRSEDRRKVRTLVVNGVAVEWHAAVAEVPKLVRDGKFVVARGWMDGASFGVFALTPEAVFVRDVEVDPFVMENRGGP